MPSHLKFRIKHPDESQVSPYSSYPTDLIDIYKENKSIIDTDYNIYNHTCAFLGRRTVRVGSTEKPVYLCCIKEATKDLRLKPPTQPGKIQEEDQFIVSGAERIKPSGHHIDSSILNEPWAHSVFKCKYFNITTAKADIEIGNPEYGDTLVMGCICNCYTPRGGAGLGINYDVYQGAIQGIGSYGFTDVSYFAQEYLQKYKDDGKIDKDYKGPLMTDIPDYGKYKTRASTIPYRYMMLNARAAVIPCCYWVRSTVLWYQPFWFRIIDSYYAKIEGLKKGGITKKAKSAESQVRELLVEDYQYTESDYYPPINKENEDKNRLLGRNFDFTLPYIQKGNNPRIRAVLTEEHTGPLVKNDDKSSYCKNYGGWHFHNETFFCPENCGHPDYNVRYKWGCVCNGGGSYDLDAGVACPYYYNPLYGDYRQDRHASLQKMYPGAHVTAAAILELMWLAKGGEPWTEEEWDAVWKTPDIWVHLTHSPVAVSEYGDYEKPVTTLVYTKDGVPRDIIRDNRKLGKRKSVFFQPRLESKKYTVNLRTGLVESNDSIFLSGGTRVHMKVGSDGKGVDQENIPDFPSFVEKLELEPISKLRITFPRFEWESEGIDPSTPEEYQQKIELIQEEISKVYNKLYWTEKGAYTLLMGFVSSGYGNRVDCINLSFITGHWAKEKEFKKLINLLKDDNYLEDSNQEILDEFFVDLLNSKAGGNIDIIGNANAVKSQALGDGGSFLFRDIPLNPLIDENILMILTQHKSGRWDVASVKIRPQFRHAWVFQKSTTLMSDWKNFNGQPRRITVSGSAITGRASEHEQSILDIPANSGLTTWNYVSISQPHGEVTTSGQSAWDVAIKDVLPYKTYQPAYIDKLQVYDSREDVGDIGIKVDPESGSELGISEWHLLASCSPYVLFVGDPSIFNADTEAMIFDMTAVVKNSKGEEVSRISLIPVAYSQVDRIFPGYREDYEDNWSVEYQESFWEKEIFKEVGSDEPIKTVVSNGMVEVDNPLANLYLDETDHHPWVIIAKAVDLDSLGTWKDILDNPISDNNENPIVLIKSLTDLYVNFAYIKDREYKFDGEEKTWYNNEVTTQIAPRTPGNMYRTLFKYSPFNDDYKVDGFDEVLYGAKTMHALWPYHRLGCRDLEISYTWHNMINWYACSPYSYYCYGPRTPRGSLRPFTGKSISGSSGQKNLIGRTPKWHATCCGDHDFTRACGGSHGPVWYPYVGGCSDVPRYEVLNDCLWDFSYAVPYDILQKYLAGNFSAVGLERLRGPQQYEANCIRNPSPWPFPCFEQTIFENYIRSPEPNLFDGWFKCRGQVYPEDLKSISPQGTEGSLPQFGNVGREIWMTDLCYMKEKTKEIRGGLSGDERTKNYTVFDVPDNQVRRSVESLTSNAVNPFNYYILTDFAFSEYFDYGDSDLNKPLDDIAIYGNHNLVGYNKILSDKTTYWAWPESEKDILTRGYKFIRKDDKERTSNQYLLYENRQIGGLIFDCPGYKKMSRNKDISLGPVVTEFDDEMKSYYLIYTKSESYNKGVYKKPILASKKLESPNIIPNFTIDDFDVDLRYHVTSSGITNQTISNSKHLVNTVNEAANFITNTTLLYIEEDNPLPVLYMQETSVCIPAESTTTMSGLIVNGESQNLAGCIPIDKDGTLMVGADSSGWGLGDYVDDHVTTINKAHRIVKYTIEDLWIGTNPIRALECIFTTNVRNWVSDTGSAGIGVEVYDSAGQYIYVPVGEIANETGMVVEIGFKDPSPDEKITIIFHFSVGEWLGSPDTSSSSQSNQNFISFSNIAPMGMEHTSGDVGDTTTFNSSFWRVGLGSIFTAIGIYSYKYTQFYPGLNITSADPQYLGKIPATRDVETAFNETYLAEYKFGSLSTLSVFVDVKDISESIVGVYITYDDEFIKNDDLQIELEFEGRPADTSIKGTLVSTFTHILPLSRNAWFYEINFPICTTFGYTFRIRSLKKEVVKIKTSKSETHLPVDKEDTHKLQLQHCIKTVKNYILKPGECAEIIEIDEAGFWTSLGNMSLRNNCDYDFYTQTTTDMYQVQWENSPLGREAYPAGPKVPVVIPPNYNPLGGVWTNNISVDPLISSQSTLVPAPHFGTGFIKTKGRHYIFNNQYKDCWDVNSSTPYNDPKYCKNVINAPATDVVDQYENYQQELWKVAKDLNNDDYFFNTQFKLSPHEWLAIENITGVGIKDYYTVDSKDSGKGSATYDRSPLTKDMLDAVKVPNCNFIWHRWTWDEVVDFNFNSLERRRYGPPGPPKTYGGLATWSPPGHVVDFIDSDSRVMIDKWGWSSTLQWVIIFLSTRRTMYAWTDMTQSAWAYDQVSEEFFEAMDGYGNPAEAHVLNERYQDWLYRTYVHLLEERDKTLSAHWIGFIKGNYLWYLQFQKHMEVVDRPVDYDGWDQIGIF